MVGVTFTVAKRPVIRPGMSAGGVIHSDHGVQFTSLASTARAKQSRLVPSMGSTGDCYDNAMIKSFWARMQTGLLNHRKWGTHIELVNATCTDLEIFHNRQRRHSALGFRTPIEYELSFTKDTLTAVS